MSFLCESLILLDILQLWTPQRWKSLFSKNMRRLFNLAKPSCSSVVARKSYLPNIIFQRPKMKLPPPTFVFFWNMLWQPVFWVRPGILKGCHTGQALSLVPNYSWDFPSWPKHQSPYTSYASVLIMCTQRCFKVSQSPWKTLVHLNCTPNIRTDAGTSCKQLHTTENILQVPLRWNSSINLSTMLKTRKKPNSISPITRPGFLRTY